jgi:hypothetical protein
LITDTYTALAAIQSSLKLLIYSEITPKVPSLTTHDFTQILANKPEVVHYIRGLTIYLKDYGLSADYYCILVAYASRITLNGKVDSSWGLNCRRPSVRRFYPFYVLKCAERYNTTKNLTGWVEH